MRRVARGRVISDEKCVYLVNHNQRERWVLSGEDLPLVPRQDLFGQKVMICVWF